MENNYKDIEKDCLKLYSLYKLLEREKENNIISDEQFKIKLSHTLKIFSLLKEEQYDELEHKYLTHVKIGIIKHNDKKYMAIVQRQELWRALGEVRL